MKRSSSRQEGQGAGGAYIHNMQPPVFSDSEMSPSSRGISPSVVTADDGLPGEVVVRRRRGERSRAFLRRAAARINRGQKKALCGAAGQPPSRVVRHSEIWREYRRGLAAACARREAVRREARLRAMFFPLLGAEAPRG